MIEKLDPLDIIQREQLVSKINELIDAQNQLIERFDMHIHYHTTLDTKYHTTGPKDSGYSE